MESFTSSIRTVSKALNYVCRAIWSLAVLHRRPKTRQGVVTSRPNLTETELQDLRTAFGLLDRNCDGQVSVAELQFMLRNLGFEFPDDVVHHLVSGASHSGDGLIDEAEFFQWIGRIQALRQDSETETSEDEITKDLIAAFRVFDRDGNGYITRDELKAAMDVIGETVTEEQLNEMLTLADVDKDGRINYEEFARLLL